jgi:hypothetical protein
VQSLPAHTGADGVAVHLGSETARERFWLQFDGVGDATAAAAAAWAVVESLLSDRVSRYRLPVLSRSRLAVVLPPPGLPTHAAEAPYLDAGVVGAQTGVLPALRRFQPTWVVHVQDWSGRGAAGVEPEEVGLAVAAGRGEAEGRTSESWMRVVESYLLPEGLHRDLERQRSPRTWLRRPTHAARALGEAPDARICAGAVRYAARMGYDAVRPLGRAGRDHMLSEAAVIEVGPGRFIPRLAWRRLGGGNLVELALAELGAGGLTGQLAGGAASRRVGRALALTEGAIVHRLNLEQAEGES